MEYWVKPNISLQIMLLKKSKYGKLQNKYRDTFMRKYEDKLRGRPCIDNMLEEGVNMFTERNFVWKGKNIEEPLILNDNKSRNIYLNQVLIPALQSFHNTEAKKEKFKQLTLTNRKKYFWNYIKNKPIFAIMSNGIPAYYNLNIFDKNGKLMIDLMEDNGYLNLLNI